MTKPVKYVLLAVGCLLLAFALWVGYWLLKVDAYAELVNWQTSEGGLTLLYHPLKDHKSFFVGDEYVTGSTRSWILTNPGGSQRLIGAPELPGPETLFREAWPVGDVVVSAPQHQPDPRYGHYRSTVAGLVRIYEDATERQRRQIRYELEFAQERDPQIRTALSAFWDSGDYPWLGEVLGGVADMRHDETGEPRTRLP